MRSRVVPATVQVAQNGIVCDLVSGGLSKKIAIEVDIAHDGVSEKAQPAGLPSCDREVASDRIVFKVAVLKSGAGDAAATSADGNIPADGSMMNHHLIGILGR